MRTRTWWHRAWDASRALGTCFFFSFLFILDTFWHIGHPLHTRNRAQMMHLSRCLGPRYIFFILISFLKQLINVFSFFFFFHAKDPLPTQSHHHTLPCLKCESEGCLRSLHLATNSDRILIGLRFGWCASHFHFSVRSESNQSPSSVWVIYSESEQSDVVWVNRAFLLKKEKLCLQGELNPRLAGINNQRCNQLSQVTIAKLSHIIIFIIYFFGISASHAFWWPTSQWPLLSLWHTPWHTTSTITQRRRWRQQGQRGGGRWRWHGARDADASASQA